MNICQFSSASTSSYYSNWRRAVAEDSYKACTNTHIFAVFVGDAKGCLADVVVNPRFLDTEAESAPEAKPGPCTHKLGIRQHVSARQLGAQASRQLRRESLLPFPTGLTTLHFTPAILNDPSNVNGEAKSRVIEHPIARSNPMNSGDDFGLSSGDEAALLQAENTNPLKRKSDADTISAVKSARTQQNGSFTVKLANDILEKRFRISSGFRLKQEAVIDRLLQGDSSVVIFPTGAQCSIIYAIVLLT